MEDGKLIPLNQSISEGKNPWNLYYLVKTIKSTFTHSLHYYYVIVNVINVHTVTVTGCINTYTTYSFLTNNGSYKIQPWICYWHQIAGMSKTRTLVWPLAGCRVIYHVVYILLLVEPVSCLQRKRQRQQRRRIDRSMIGEPTNFQHTGHIGSGDVEVGNARLRAIQSQMESKGGYETSFTTLKVRLVTFHSSLLKYNILIQFKYSK